MMHTFEANSVKMLIFATFTILITLVNDKENKIYLVKLVNSPKKILLVKQMKII